ncbi:hypothetical protein [Eshraghiella crossota]|jgi:hypothetical protein|uniref:hypothetical protein n=1 Tax=Eshraghiella crossota TaxID=45851 RepID=UPI003FEDC63F
MDNKEKLNKPENNEEFIIPEFEDYQSKKKPDVDEVIKKLNERITALEAEENTLEEIKEILEKHNLKYLCDPDLNAVEIMFDERPFRVQIILNEYRLELKLIFPFAAQRASLAMIALFMINFNKDKAFACMHLNPDNGEMSMKYSYFISKTAGLDVDDFWVYMTSIIMPAIEKEYVILHCMSTGRVPDEYREYYKNLLEKSLTVINGENEPVDEIEYGFINQEEAKKPTLFSEPVDLFKEFNEDADISEEYVNTRMEEIIKELQEEELPFGEEDTPYEE